jgi:hypothetical protein
MDIDWKCLGAADYRISSKYMIFYGLSTFLVIQSKAAQVNLSFVHPYRALDAVIYTNFYSRSSLHRIALF